MPCGHTPVQPEIFRARLDDLARDREFFLTTGRAFAEYSHYLEMVDWVFEIWYEWRLISHSPGDFAARLVLAYFLCRNEQTPIQTFLTPTSEMIARLHSQYDDEASVTNRDAVESFWRDTRRRMHTREPFLMEELETIIRDAPGHVLSDDDKLYVRLSLALFFRLLLDAEQSVTDAIHDAVTR